ncbi:MAG TPA: PHP domain-containing protein, partial [Micromonosporaceae bacterium]|nr:PHP domain-containing protein [Micromonosporaceae bacterium]
MTLPQDGHVHTEWSWDTDVGSMERSCARAVEFGVPSIAFTEHADFTEYRVTPQDTFQPPALDVAGYLACVRQCRERFPGLRILSGVELGEPHWHAERVQTLLSTMDCDRLLGSVHTVRIGGDVLGIPGVYRIRPAAEAVRLYLAEVLRLVETSSVFGVLAHID